MTEAALAEHEKCNRCDRDYRMWSTDSPLWNAVMRGGCINGPWEFGEMLCPNCFMEMAEDRGVARNFRVVADDVLVALQTVTPSGRVWNEKRRMWIEPGRRTVAVVTHPKRHTIEVRK